MLVEVPALHAEVSAAAPPTLLDVRWRLNEPEGRPAYLDSHLPGAVYVDLERELARPGHPELGRLPLPERADLEAALQRWGINEGDAVVVYDDNDSVAAARAWWVLRAFGLDVRVLNGGFAAWVAAGLPVERGDRAVRAGTIRLDTGGSAAAVARWDETVADIDEAAAASRLGVLIDARVPRQYRGEVAPGDPSGGHIPGAINIPAVAHIAADGRVQAPEVVRATLGARGVTPATSIVLYCNNAVPSAHSALAYALAGYSARVYAGGWSQWARTRGRPVAVGATTAEVITTF